MDFSIALILAQDGVVNGAVYALLGLALVLVFAVTRVIFIPQGEFVTFGALTLAMLCEGKAPATVWLLLMGGVTAFVMECVRSARAQRFGPLARAAFTDLVYPAVMFWLVPQLAGVGLPLWGNVLIALALVVPLGPMLYRIAYQPLAEASVLVLLIASVAVHFALTGLGLVFFGPEGRRTPEFLSGMVDFGLGPWSSQSLFVVIASAILIFLMWLFFGFTLYGRALRATAVNRRGARLVGISTVMSGRITFMVAALVGAISGMLIAPMTTVYYDAGFLIGLKGFVAAIIGGMSSYPLAAAGALVVGLLEAFASFWASAYKEVIVFTLIIPVLLWRSLTTHHIEDEE
ncbi:MAG: branched-chain amino acid ABC transporter permease [Burkholderiaceae bacterium]|nr:branched-chain amino acid ABC transporter permease [Burkholderiaceae bacterium]